MVAVLRTVRSIGVAYHDASMVIAAIDWLGTVLIGEMEPFAISGSVGPSKAKAVRARQREVGAD